MTEQHLRAQLRTAVERAYAAGYLDAVIYTAISLPLPERAQRRAVSTLAVAEAAEDLVLPVVADLVQEALEEGFDGRAALATLAE